MRFTAKGMSMAKPCQNCERVLRRAGVAKVRYTDRFGNWQELLM